MISLSLPAALKLQRAAEIFLFLCANLGNTSRSIIQPAALRLQLPKNKAVDLDLAGGKIKTDHLDNFSGRMDEDEIKGKLNGGGIPVSVRANSGRIYLELK